MRDLIDRQAAIDALEEPCKVSDTWTDEYAVGERMQWEKDVKVLNSLPSAQPEPDGFTKWALSVADSHWAQPERKTGKWKIKVINTFELAYGSTGYEPVYECSECGGIEESYLRFDEPIMPEDADFPRFCPNCGARMEGNT